MDNNVVERKKLVEFLTQCPYVISNKPIFIKKRWST